MIRRLAAVAVGCSAVAGRSDAQSMRNFSVSRPISSERFLHVTLDLGGGNFVVAPDPAAHIYAMQLRYDPDRYEPLQQYDARTGILHAGLAATDGNGVRLASRSDVVQSGRFSYSRDIPLSLYATLSASEASIDLGGSTLTELEVRTSASHAVVDFSTPTRGSCKSETFAVTAAEIDVRHLANGPCQTLTVSGAAGGATLSFDGTWRQNASVVVDLSMGKLVVVVPRSVALRLTGDRFLSPLDHGGLIRDGDAWTTPGYDHAVRRISVELRAAVATIRLKWIE